MDILPINHLDVAEIKRLLEAGGEIRVSMMLPVQQEVDKRDENRIRLKNCVQEAQSKLAALAGGPPDSERFVAPATELVSGGRFLDISAPGLAIYLADGFSRAYQLPYAPEMNVTAAGQFQIKQLLPSLTQEPFFILLLGQDSVRLLWATQYTVQRVDLGAAAQSLDEALSQDDPERQLQWHSKTGDEGDGRAAMYHGHGVDSKEKHKENLLRYFQILSKGVEEQLAGEEAPLLLAGVDYLLPIYRETNSYATLFENALTGNYEHLSDAEVQGMAWELVEPYFAQKRDALISRYQELAAKELATADPAAALQAAYQGRVETLLIALDARQWGVFEPATGRVTVHAEQEAGDDELVNLTAVYTLRNGGEVYAAPRAGFPERKQVLALLRF